MKKLLLVVSAFALVLTLAGCKKDTTDPVVVPTCTATQELVNNVCVEKVVDPTCTPTISVDGLFANRNLRLALAYSIDRDAIVAVLGAGQVPAVGMVPPGMLDNNGDDFYEVSGNYGVETDDTNYAEAVQLFALAAQEMGLTVAELQAELEKSELLYNTSEGHALVAQLVQQAWETNLGFTIPLANEEWAVFQDTRSQGNFEIARGGWLTDFMDPAGLLSIFASSNSYNDPNFYNAEFDALMAESQATTDPAIHFAKLYEAQELFMYNMPIVPVYHYTDTMLASNNVQDWDRSVLGSVDFSFAYMEDDEGVATVDQVLNWNIGADPATLDPSLNGASDGGDVINQTFEALVREINGVILPGVAESWDTSTDGLTVTFHLRESLWSNGEPLVAGDFVYAWLRGMDPETASEYSWIWEYTNVVGAQAFAEGTGTAAEVGIEATDDHTLVVELINPTAYFVSLMAFYHFMPVYQPAVEAVGGEDGIWAKDPALVVSNGPFVLTSYTIQDGLTLEKNTNFWNADAVNLLTINGKFNDDANSAYASYQNGQLDFIPSVPSAEVATLIAESDEFYVFPLLGTYYYSFNMDQDGDGVNELGTVCPVN